ncbi:hypothetical protein EC991_002292, partial [Linnemannia zychae]
ADVPYVRVIRIFELATLIGGYLARKDRLTCVKVSKDWNEAFTPALYYDMDDCHVTWTRIFKSHDDPTTNNGQDRDWILALFKKYGCHIRRLSTQWRVAIDAAYLGQTCTQLKSFSTYNFSSSYTLKELEDYERVSEEGELTYEDRMTPAKTGDFISPEFIGDVFSPMIAGWRTLEQQEQDWLTSQYFWLLIRQNPSLRSLTLAWSLNELFDVSPEYVYGVLASLPQLTTLNCSLGRIELERVLESCPQLQVYESYSTTLWSSDLGQEWPMMQTLDLSMQVASEDFIYIIRRLPGLLHLQLGGFQSRSVECTNVAELLGNRPSKLRTLKITMMRRSYDEWLGTLVFPWLPDLIEYSGPCLGESIACAIVTHCKGFQVYLQTYFPPSVHDTYQSGTIPNVFRHLLEGCPNLRVLDSVSHTIDGQSLEGNRWVCLGLEKLRCRLVGFTRLTASDEVNLSEEWVLNISSIEELKERQRVSREQQQMVLYRLSTFTRLRVLDLGYEFRDLQLARIAHTYRNYYANLERPAADTMELSLASGLACLAPLKELEVFGFEGIDHRIETPELEWIATNWPKLKVMRGLQDDNIPGDRYRARKTILREHFQVLRPDVVHETGPRCASRV